MYNKSKFQFKTPILEKFFFKINKNFSIDDFTEIDLLGVTSVSKSSKENLASVSLELTIGDESKKSPFYIEISMKSIFKWDENFENSTIDELLRINAPSLLLSYMRPIVANVTSVSEFPGFDIPFLDMRNNKADFYTDFDDNIDY